MNTSIIAAETPQGHDESPAMKRLFELASWDPTDGMACRTASSMVKVYLADWSGLSELEQKFLWTLYARYRYRDRGCDFTQDEERRALELMTPLRNPSDILAAEDNPRRACEPGGSFVHIRYSREYPGRTGLFAHAEQWQVCEEHKMRWWYGYGLTEPPREAIRGGEEREKFFREYTEGHCPGYEEWESREGAPDA